MAAFCPPVKSAAGSATEIERHLTDTRRSGINDVLSVFLSAILRKEAGDMIHRIFGTRHARSLTETLAPQI
jgi:hypothetical protein